MRALVLVNAALAIQLCTIQSFTTLATAQECPKVRPTDDADTAAWSYGDAEAASFDSAAGNVRVWYALGSRHAPDSPSETQPPESVELVASIAEEALQFFTERGFRRPLGDGDYPSCASNGGDGRLDIYLYDFANSDGTIQSDRCQTTANVTACSGFMIIENDFSGLGYDTPEQAFRTVVPHELFHLVQQAYSAEMDLWWTEGTAQWATKALYPDLSDLESYLPFFFRDLDRPLDFPPSGAAQPYNYGSALWPIFLGERYGQEVVASAFERAAAGDAPTTAAIDAALQEKDTTLVDAYALFAQWNAATGRRAGDGGYEHAATYPMAELAPVSADVPASVADISAGLNSRYFLLEPAEPVTVFLDGNGPRGVAVPLTDGAADLDSATPLPAHIAGSTVVVVTGTTTNRADAPFTLRVEDPESNPLPPPGEPPSPNNPPGNSVLGSEGACSLSGRTQSPGDALLALALTALLGTSRRRSARHGRGASDSSL